MEEDLETHAGLGMRERRRGRQAASCCAAVEEARAGGGELIGGAAALLGLGEAESDGPKWSNLVRGFWWAYAMFLSGLLEHVVWAAKIDWSGDDGSDLSQKK